MPRRRTALALLAILGGAALAAPLPVLEIEAGVRHTVPVAPTGEFRYTYRQSIYDAPVDEGFRVESGRLRLTEVRSPDRRALEYFGWPGDVREAGGWLTIQAPGGTEEQLTIRIASGARQRLDALRSIALDRLGAEVVTVRAGTRPAVAWTWTALPWTGATR